MSSWSAHRRALIIVLLAAVGVTLASGIGFAVLYKVPSCTDGVKNQDETGIDCGGSCPYLCESAVTPPVVRIARAIADEPGRVDAFFYVDNPNASAASYAAPYTLSLYDASNTLIAEQSGTTELPPSATTPLFFPGIVSGDRTVAETFLTFGTNIPWKRYVDTRIIPTVTTPVVTDAATTPRISAAIGNPSALPLANVKLIVAVFDDAGTVIAASQTVLPVIPPQSSATATFTWNVPFSAPPAKVEVTPVVPL
ncbi:MAG: hypothetical protein KGI41_02700 [Patescibacteria group bacterium]|nr:hypothetical protein [Patescibacteria group bacterium]MDE1966123.1 hypothetical protein [Patescibacteria group bacterium]